jgi:hypothetical protein
LPISHTIVGEDNSREFVEVGPNRVKDILASRGSLAGDGEEMSDKAGGDTVGGRLA